MHHLDLAVFHLINGGCGGWLADQIVAFEEGRYLFRALPLILYWWFWFSADTDRRDQHRRILVGALLGTFVALLLARGMALALPFRPRPMHELGLGYRAPLLPIARNMEDWSSFPSDTAALFFALSFGIWRLSRPLGVALMTYSAVWICLPRIYLGIHYPSDILVGALLGIAVVWATLRILEAPDGALGRRILASVSGTEVQRPGLFYATAFVASFEMAMLFDDVRAFGRAGLHWLHHGGAGLGMGVIAITAIGLLMALAAVAVLLRRRPQHQVRAALRVS
ncbi:MAG TPA: phosphatase PAP2 family protein [Acetobacteraceae bacterium]|nr:phosphatase PAP2 family protein [Acetobacteraceae bacterium]